MRDPAAPNFLDPKMWFPQRVPKLEIWDDCTWADILPPEWLPQQPDVVRDAFPDDEETQ